MRPQTVTVSSATTSSTIPVDWRAKPFELSLVVELSAGADLTYKVQYSVTDLQPAGATLVWHDHSSLAALTASASGNLAFPVRAVRLNVTAHTSGSATLNIVQA